MATRHAEARALTLGLALWFGQMVLHGQGNVLAARAFRTLGFGLGEALCAAGAACGFILLVAAVIVRRRRAAQAGCPPGWWCWRFAAVLACAITVERLFVVLHSELYHYVQYGIIGLLFMRAVPSPAGVVLFTTSLGALDEAYQWLVLNPANAGVAFDWNDVLLDLVGAMAGALGGALLWPRSGFTDPVARRHDRWALALVSLLGLAAVAIAVTHARPPHAPFWSRWDGAGGKPYHALAVTEGALLCFAATLSATLLAAPCGPARAGLALFAAASMPLLLVDQARRSPLRLAPPLPSAHARWAEAPPRIDGLIDDACWRRGRRVTVCRARDGSLSPVSMEASVCWDARALYVALRIPDADVWSVARGHDDPLLPGDEVVEFMIAAVSPTDPTASPTRYYEVEVSPSGERLDLALRADPGQPTLPGAGAASACDPGWNPRIELAVTVDGTRDSPLESLDVDRGWTVELALPFASLPRSMRSPSAGTLWRFNLFRVERPRTPKAEPRLVCWSPSLSPSFHRPGRFGWLIFSGRRGAPRDD